MNDFNQSKEADSNVSIYGSSRPLLEQTMQMLLEEIAKIREEMTEELGMDPIEHLLGRIKSELPETQESALVKIHDAIGLRVVCAFIDDVYTIRDRLLALPRICLVEEKDYIRHVKPNGYRSFHMIIIVDGQIYAEIQLRTISMDTWAALEHHLKYKKEVGGSAALISDELKRCADELAPVTGG